MTPTVALQTSATTGNTIDWIEWYNPLDPLGYIGWEQFVDLESRINASISNPSISSIVIYSPARHFSPGWMPEAWLDQDEATLEKTILRCQALLKLIQDSKKPIIAAVHGRCVGPGMELALACHGIVASVHSSTQFGIEERNLGLVPVLGATVRLARYLGLQSALHVLLSGKMYSYEEAARLKIAQLAVIPDQLLSAAGTLSESLTTRKKPQRKKELPLIQRGVERLWVGKRLILRQTSERINQAIHPSFVAPGLILEATELAWRRGESEGLTRAVQTCMDAWRNEGTTALLTLRKIALEQQKQGLGAGEAGYIRRATVLGGGRMGMGLVKLARRFDLDVHLVERNRDRIQILKTWIQKYGARLYAADAYFPDQAAEFIIESVDENIDRKKEVLADAEKYLDARGFLATNTSTLSISELSQSLKQPQRLIGMHFFMPPGAMPLVEIIPGKKTDPEVVRRARALAAQLGKVWIEVADHPGFFCTRVLGAYLHEALCLLEEGVDIIKVDYVLSQFGFVSGPFRFMDLAGLDLIQKVIEGPVLTQMQKNKDRTIAGLQALIQNGLLGQKSGKGFYLHQVDMKDNPPVNPQVYEWFGGHQRRNISTVRIQHRMTLALVNEAARCLEEGVISRPEDGDLGAVYGLGFPAFLGGPFRFADQLGIDKLVHMLEELKEDHGPRFEPASFFREKVHSEISIYQN